MRFSTSLLAAGLSASVFAAPIPEDVFEECDDESFPSSSAVVFSSSITPSHSAVASVEHTSATHSSLSKTASAAGVFTSAVSKSSSSASVVVVSTTSAASVTIPTSLPASTEAPSTSSAKVVPASSKSSAVVVLPTSTAKAVVVPTSASVVASSVVKTSSTAAAVATSTASSNGTLQWFGVNESGAEFGTAIPGVLGTDYTWPSTASIATLMAKGMNIFRIPFTMERLAPSVMTSTLDATYLASLKTVVSAITTAGGHAAIEPHNYARYAGSVITSTADFKTFWTNVATEFKDNANVIFDCNNEPHDMPTATLTAELMQACIDGVRAAGATSQYIFVEGTSYTGAWTWTTSGNSDNMGSLTDPEDKIVYEMHQYLDSDGSGTSSTCVSTTIGAERIAAATAWLKANNKKGIIGEYAGGANADCQAAVTGMLDALVAASDVWLGAMWWGGGPWWGTYIFSMEPSAGVGYVAYESILAKYTS